jgi:hypothetical protein
VPVRLVTASVLPHPSGPLVRPVPDQGRQGRRSVPSSARREMADDKHNLTD